MHAQHGRVMDWRNCWKIPGVSRIVTAAMEIHTTRSISEMTDLGVHKALHDTPEKKNSEKNKLGDLGGQEMGPLRLVHQFGNVRSRTHLS
ncbi:hypothetical protein TNCV_1557891 [Trichonephila clavipes]|uniref:Uncharacterized protein n=1 Tax=Trichonephila clavipes TaxID=2585209 RepID=A0A8X6R9U6_TRICX|nr:hypothetical protein TNCV_1557891 [Trichonephila clavipes]